MNDWLGDHTPLGKGTVARPHSMRRLAEWLMKRTWVVKACGMADAAGEVTVPVPMRAWAEMLAAQSSAESAQEVTSRACG